MTALCGTSNVSWLAVLGWLDGVAACDGVRDEKSVWTGVLGLVLAARDWTVGSGLMSRTMGV